MPQLSRKRPLYQGYPRDGEKMYTQCLIEAFDSVKFKSDVIIHCQNKTYLKTNKYSLFFSSNLSAKIIGNSDSNQLQGYDVLCPDFDPDSMAKFLELISTGSTKLRKADETGNAGHHSMSPDQHQIERKNIFRTFHKEATRTNWSGTKKLKTKCSSRNTSKNRKVYEKTWYQRNSEGWC